MPQRPSGRAPAYIIRAKQPFHLLISKHYFHI